MDSTDSFLLLVLGETLRFEGAQPSKNKNFLIWLENCIMDPSLLRALSQNSAYKHLLGLFEIINCDWSRDIPCVNNIGSLLRKFWRKNAAIALKQKGHSNDGTKMFLCKANKCHCLCFIFSFRISTYILVLKKVGIWVTQPAGKHLQLIVSSQLTYQVVRKTTVRQCHGVAIYSLATHKLHIYYYNIATNGVKNDMKPQVIRSHLPQKDSAGSAGRLKPRVAGQKDVKHRLVCSNWASQTFFQNFIGLAKACRFFRVQRTTSVGSREAFPRICLNTVTVDRIVRAHRVDFIQNEEIIAPVTRFIYLARALFGHF